MVNLLVDERDQRFVLYEMLALEELCKAEKYGDFSSDMFDMVLTEAQKLAENVIFPTLVEGDREGCKLAEGEVRVPECFHKASL